MSDPLKKDEIEDVLSSIRRLVSEEVRAMPDPEAVAPAQTSVQTAADKLVLTPSLRVEEEAAKAAENTASTEELVAQEIAKMMPGASEGSEEEQGPRVLTLSATQVAETPSEADAAEAEVVSEEVAASPELAEPQEIAVEAEATQEDTAWTAQDTPAVEWQSVRSYAEMEFDPEAAGDGEYAGTEVDALDWGHAAERPKSEARVAPEEAPAIDAASEVIDAEVVSSPRMDDAPEEAVLDEEMLRDLVGEIVRQELQGPLGERITRNVRKLVRREINRALASRQMD